MLFERSGLRLRRPVLVFGIYYYARCAMIEGLHHFAFIKWQPFSLPTLKAITLGPIGPLLFLKLSLRPEKSGIVGHVEHGRIFHRPCPDFPAG